MDEIRQHRRAQLTDVLLDITATRGLDQVSVREVASAAGVSIGTVQHYFATKDEMLVFAFRQVVERTRARLAGIDASTGSRRALGAALRELLPLDQARLAECRVYLAFAARAATSPALAAVQEETLSGIQAELEQVLSMAATIRNPGPGLDTVLEARLLLAVVDGLMFDAVSAPGTLTPAELEAALDAYLNRLLPGESPDACLLSDLQPRRRIICSDAGMARRRPLSRAVVTRLVTHIGTLSSRQIDVKPRLRA